MKRTLRQIWQNVRHPLRIALGILLVLIGIALLALPGPGWLTIFAGIFLIGPETRIGRWLHDKAHYGRNWLRRKRGKPPLLDWRQARARRQPPTHGLQQPADPAKRRNYVCDTSADAPEQSTN
ncbi:MAG: PGPGW domain-containing protein [Planctomycetota bacterium]